MGIWMVMLGLFILGMGMWREFRGMNRMRVGDVRDEKGRRGKSVVGVREEVWISLGVGVSGGVVGVYEGMEGRRSVEELEYRFMRMGIISVG